MFAMYTPWETLDNLWLTLHQFPLHVFHDVCNTKMRSCAAVLSHDSYNADDL